MHKEEVHTSRLVLNSVPLEMTLVSEVIQPVNNRDKTINHWDNQSTLGKRLSYSKLIVNH